jgi:DNA-directed RNA polymerase subunit RPC12/RpoP
VKRPPDVTRRRQFCARCGQLIFEYFRSPDGHFGLVDDIARASGEDRREIRCPTCGARYRLLKRLDPAGRPVVRG